jgi:hypothetical protein
MAFNPSTPITGATVTGLTSPTYTIAQDVAPSQNGKQFAVTALGGTQTGVDVNSVSKPFSITFFRPMVLKALPAPNVLTGVVKSVPRNTYKLITRKGAKPLATQQDDLIRITTIFEIPAGVDTYEPEEIRAAVSAHIGTLSAQASGIADTLVTGVL